MQTVTVYLTGGGAFFFGGGGGHFLAANLIEKNSVSEMGEKKDSFSTLCLQKYCFCRKIIISRQFVSKIIPDALRSEKNRLTHKKP